MTGLPETNWLVTGGAGFIGVNFVIKHIAAGDVRVVNLDKLTYAGNAYSLDGLKGNTAHSLVHGEIGDRRLVKDLLIHHKPIAVINFAAETHVDRSIVGPGDFVDTNVVGTFNLLETVLDYWQNLPAEKAAQFRFLHVSTDEVFGTLEAEEPAFSEETRYAPKSPYAASKAASDHFVRAFQETYGLPTLTTNCSNNFGPYQFPEKLIPLVIARALEGKPLPIYGDGLQMRDWLYVDDHCEAIRLVLEYGEVAQTYNIGGNNEMTNLSVVTTICDKLDEIMPDSPHCPHRNLMTHVKDRPGHDRRYAINSTKIEKRLGWRARETFSTGIEKTIRWYLGHQEWLDQVRSGNYRDWIKSNYSDR